MKVVVRHDDGERAGRGRGATDEGVRRAGQEHGRPGKRSGVGIAGLGSATVTRHPSSRASRASGCASSPAPKIASETGGPIRSTKTLACGPGGASAGSSRSRVPTGPPGFSQTTASSVGLPARRFSSTAAAQRGRGAGVPAAPARRRCSQAQRPRPGRSPPTCRRPRARPARSPPRGPTARQGPPRGTPRLSSRSAPPRGDQHPRPGPAVGRPLDLGEGRQDPARARAAQVRHNRLQFLHGGRDYRAGAAFTTKKGPSWRSAAAARACRWPRRSRCTRRAPAGEGRARPGPSAGSRS